MANNTYYKELPDHYLSQVLKWEGGYTEDKDDAGNKYVLADGTIMYTGTNMGITFRALQTAKSQGLVSKDLTVKDLTHNREAVRKIYNHNYFLAGKCDRMPNPLAFAHFDMCVNSGLGGRTKKGTAIGAGANLQKTILKLNGSVTLDGVVGPLTLKALAEVLTRHTPEEVTKVYNDTREAYYHSIVKNRPLNAKFLKGWLNRLNDVRKFCA